MLVHDLLMITLLNVRSFPKKASFMVTHNTYIKFLPFPNSVYYDIGIHYKTSYQASHMLQTINRLLQNQLSKTIRTFFVE